MSNKGKSKNKRLDELYIMRESIKMKLQTFITYVNELNSSSLNQNTKIEQTEFQLRYEKTKELFNKFDTVQDEIETLASSVAEEFEIRKPIENEFLAVLSGGKIMVDSFSNSPVPAAVTAVPVPIQNSVTLPKIDLPQFSGEYNSWLEFRDTFVSVIHNKNIDNVLKFRYLKSCLRGEAAKIISYLETSDDNYNIAWNSLCDRYNKYRLLVNNHMKALFSIPQLEKESAKGIRNMVNEIAQHLRALEILKEPVNYWDSIIIHLICNKLDPVTAREWESQVKDSESPTLSKLFSFLNEKADTLEKLMINPNKTFNKFSNNYQAKQRENFNNNKTSSDTKVYLATNTSKCTFCNQNHNILVCAEFNNLSIEKRLEQVKSKRLCLNCLRTGHFIRGCKASLCKKCNGKHHTLLHKEKGAEISNETSDQNTNTNICLNNETEQVTLLNSFDKSTTEVLLATAIIDVVDVGGNTKKCRVLLDSGSQSNLITTDFINKLGLATTPVKLSLSGIGPVKSSIDAKTVINIKSRAQNNCWPITCLITNSICERIPSIKLSKLNIPKHVKLADSNYNIPEKIDMLIGADLFWRIIEPDQINLGDSLPILQKTKLGWIITGPITRVSDSIYCNFSKLSQPEIIDIQDQLSKFWLIEDCSVGVVRSAEELECEKHFNDTTKRDETGKFIVKIPLKHSVDNLGESRQQALSQFLSLENRLNSNPRIKQLYDEFMLDYIQVKHMSKVSDSSSDQIVSYYMPHHGVLREDSETTKLRVVFNASAPTTTGVSFNELQMVGPTIQSDLFSILIRSREYAFVVCADIKQMYRQVLVDENQQQLQKILWRFSQTEEISEYSLNTVTYGTASAPFLAIRCLYELSNDCSNTQSEASRIIRDDFYVDDLITGGNDIDELTNNCNIVSEKLISGNFELRKWKSNSPEILKKLDVNASEMSQNLGQNDKTKTLGIFWDCKSDCFTFKIKTNTDGKITKRHILSNISQIFDPLGLLAVCTITAKILLQSLWLEKLNWDDPVPESIRSKWTGFCSALSQLNNLEIPRYISICKANRKEIHVFCDASKDAYGACLYVRSEDVNSGVILSNLLCAKSKVAPLKPLSTPRLELCAAVIGVRLLDKMLKSSRTYYDGCTLWSDSTIVLAWIKTPPNQLKPFVCNRIVEIQSITSNYKWQHVPTKDNPADLLSRGLSPLLIKECNLWWHGPSWLSQNLNYWPKSNSEIHENLPELKQTRNAFLNLHTQATEDILRRFSNLDRLKRVISYCFRFIHNCLKKRKKENLQYGPLTTSELQLTQNKIIKVIQIESFNNEYECLAKNKQISRQSRLISLNPFLDSNGIIRIGGRLTLSNFNYDKKHPIILPPKHYFTKLLFKNEHRRLLHTGPQQLLYSIRENFWPLSGRNLAKETVRKCTICFKVKPKSVQPIMGNLPSNRVNQLHPFLVCGVDYGGPIMLKDRKGRGSKIYKAYICLFVCFVTKAIHLELVTNLTKDAFIAAFRRFVARRGKPAEVNSDNGTNFVGANNELHELGQFLLANNDNLQTHFASDDINWKLIPAHSPHMRGLWEAGIRSAKHHLKRVAGNASLTYEYFVTLLNQIEAVLNSRPLSTLSVDPDDPLPLTPAHFLVGRSLTSLPDSNVQNIPENRLSLYQRVQQLHQHFWVRWAKEYVSELQQRTKWKTKCKDLKLGTIVLVKEDNIPPLCWLLGIVTELHPGRDGVTRVASVKTSKGTIKRAVVKLCPLPSHEE